MVKQTTWEIASNKVLTTPKFVRRGTKVLVRPVDPQEIEVDGRFGKRQMYIIETVENGLVLVSPMQLVKIARVFNGDFTSAVTVEL